MASNRDVDLIDELPTSGGVTTPPSAAPQVRGRRPPQGDPVVDRAFALLAAFDAGHRSLSLGELSRRSGIPTSSALRLATRLMAWGALERDANGRFTIGLRLWEVASLAPRGAGTAAGGPAVHARPRGGHPPARAARGPRRRRRAAGRAAVLAPGDAGAVPGGRPAAAALDRGRPGAARLRRRPRCRRRCSPSR